MTTKLGRVVLNLSIDQAVILQGLLANIGDETARKICLRIQKTLNKPAKEAMPELQRAMNEVANELI